MMLQQYIRQGWWLAGSNVWLVNVAKGYMDSLRKIQCRDLYPANSYDKEAVEHADSCESAHSSINQDVVRNKLQW